MHKYLIFFSVFMLMSCSGFGAELNEKPLVSMDSTIVLSFVSKGMAVASLRSNTTTVDAIVKEVLDMENIQLGMNNERNEFTSIAIVHESGMMRSNLERLRSYGVIKGLAGLSSSINETVEANNNSVVKKSSLNIKGVALTNVVNISSSGETKSVLRSIRLLCNGEKMALVLEEDKIKMFTYVSSDSLLKRLRIEGLDIMVNKELVLIREHPAEAQGWLSEIGGNPVDKVAKAVSYGKKPFSYAAIVTIRLDQK